MKIQETKYIFNVGFLINLLEIIISKVIPFLLITNYWLKEEEKGKKIVEE